MHPEGASRVGLGLHGRAVDLDLGDLELQLVDQVGDEVLRDSRCDVGLVERVHVLIKAAEAVVVAVALKHEGQMCEPNQLSGLMEVPWRELRHHTAVLSHGEKLQLALRIIALTGHLFRQVGIAVGVVDDRLKGYDKGFPVVLLSDFLHVNFVERVELGQFCLALIYIVSVAALYQIVIVRRVGAGVLLTASDGEDSELLHQGVLLVYLALGIVAEGVALPLCRQSAEFIFLAGQELIGIKRPGIAGLYLVGEPGQDVHEHGTSNKA